MQKLFVQTKNSLYEITIIDGVVKSRFRAGSC